MTSRVGPSGGLSIRNVPVLSRSASDCRSCSSTVMSRAAEYLTSAAWRRVSRVRRTLSSWRAAALAADCARSQSPAPFGPCSSQHASLALADMRRLPFADNSFDAVVRRQRRRPPWRPRLGQCTGLRAGAARPPLGDSAPGVAGGRFGERDIPGLGLVARWSAVRPAALPSRGSWWRLGCDAPDILPVGRQPTGAHRVRRARRTHACGMAASPRLRILPTLADRPNSHLSSVGAAQPRAAPFAQLLTPRSQVQILPPLRIVAQVRHRRRDIRLGDRQEDTPRACVQPGPTSPAEWHATDPIHTAATHVDGGLSEGFLAGRVSRRRTLCQPASDPPKICQARADFATRLSTR